MRNHTGQQKKLIKQKRNHEVQVYEPNDQHESEGIHFGENAA